MSDATPDGRGALHASLREVEPGLFRAEYVGELNPANPDARAFPDTHLGTSEQDVKIWVEQMARSLGYQSVIWDPLPGAPSRAAG
ncbi:MAG TPA: hypothetical protein VFN42_02145 [Acetobacteraceae bacterium]|nr:hypothetical protein [Acetobacteraceae bacterium]